VTVSVEWEPIAQLPVYGAPFVVRVPGMDMSSSSEGPR
jgi:hypothetical protein